MKRKIKNFVALKKLNIILKQIKHFNFRTHNRQKTEFDLLKLETVKAYHKNFFLLKVNLSLLDVFNENC